MLDFGRFLLGIGIIGYNLKDLSIGTYTIDLETPFCEYKALYIGLLLLEIRILFVKTNGKERA
jgi:hypothetical protein